MKFKLVSFESLECAVFKCSCGSGQFIIKDNGYLYCSNCGMKRN